MTSARHPANDSDHEPDCDCGDCDERRAETMPSPEEDRPGTTFRDCTLAPGGNAYIYEETPEDRPARHTCDCGCERSIIGVPADTVVTGGAAFLFASQACLANWTRRTFTEAGS